VVQVPNTPSDELLLGWIRVIRETWPELEHDSIAHVFGEHVPLEFGPHVLPYIPPEDVEERTFIRVLLAKDAVTTGWDCPRAEVLISFRSAQDQTHITQLLGRMVRTPLARRIPGDDRLNSVDCILPLFNRKTRPLSRTLSRARDTSTVVTTTRAGQCRACCSARST